MPIGNKDWLLRVIVNGLVVQELGNIMTGHHYNMISSVLSKSYNKSRNLWVFAEFFTYTLSARSFACGGGGEVKVE